MQSLRCSHTNSSLEARSNKLIDDILAAADSRPQLPPVEETVVVERHVDLAKLFSKAVSSLGR